MRFYDVTFSVINCIQNRFDVSLIGITMYTYSDNSECQSIFPQFTDIMFTSYAINS